MNAYRFTGTFAGDRTITVKVPEEASACAEAEIIVLFPEATPEVRGEHPLKTFLGEMRRRPVEPDGEPRAEEEQAFLRELREEWNEPPALPGPFGRPRRAEPGVLFRRVPG